MRILRYSLVVAVAAATMATGAGPAAAAPSSAGPTARAGCSAGTLHGTYRHGLTIRGSCTIGSKAHVTVLGRLKLAPGATLAVADGAHLRVVGRIRLRPGSAFDALSASTVRIKGDTMVGRGAMFVLGCSKALTQPPFPGAPPFCKAVSHDRVDGSIRAWRALTLKINGVTIRGDVISYGGGRAVTGPDAGNCEEHPAPLNFVFKDNIVKGAIQVIGWQGCWIGFIRNVQTGDMLIAGNTTAETDSTEIVTNKIKGNLLCYGNVPAPQVGDSMGSANLVTGAKLGQCAGL